MASNIEDIIKRTNKVAANKAKMEALMKQLTPDSREAAKNYVSQKEIPQLFESITAGMLHHRPENPVEFLQECLDKLSKTKGSPRWDTFINFNPSEKSMRPASRPVSSTKSDGTSTKSENNTSNNASFTPAPISAHPSNRSRASDIQSFPE